MISSSPPLYGVRSNGGRHGDVFTSPVVVSFMLDRVNYTSSRNLSRVHILEPSCGDGEFLAEIAHRLLISAARYHFDASEAFNRNVRAYDIDREKVDRCRRRIAELGIFLSEECIQEADFLKAETEKADIVVGNPPYIRYENIPREMVDFCHYTFSSFHYRCDLYVPFFEKTLASLRPGGLHCFVCSNRWLKNEYGRKLRQLIAHKYALKTIVNLEHADAFQEEVLAYPAITVISADKPDGSFEYAECEKVSGLDGLSYCRRRMPKGDDWSSAFSADFDNPSFLTIEQQGFKIGIGAATGADAVFVSSDLPQKVESELIMPGVNARDLRGNRFQWRGEYLLNPYNADGSLVDLTAYPRASAYLEHHRDRLSARHVARKSPSRWYKTIDRISPGLLAQPKILLPDISGNTFVFVDEGKFYPLHNIYYITGHSDVQLRLLATFLMSDFIREQLSAVTNTMNGGFPRWQSQHLRKLRLPDLSTLPENDVQDLLYHYEQGEIASINSTLKKYFVS